MNRQIKNEIDNLYNAIISLAKLVWEEQQKGKKINTTIYVKLMDNLYNNISILKEVLK